MIAAQQHLIERELQEGTGAGIALAVDQSGMRTGLRIWFADLAEKQGPVASLRPHGLRGYKVELGFGSFSAPTIAQIKKASWEDVQLARALVKTAAAAADIGIANQTLEGWQVLDGSFRLSAVVKHESHMLADEAIAFACREVIVPVMAAMAELIGYDVIEDEAAGDDESRPEGALTTATVTRRERNPRNRLLCIRLHGEKCVCCGISPKIRYRSAGAIIEVHHLEPLSLLTAPKVYDPLTDLVPLCPNCHRAVHTRRPVPLTPEELRATLNG